MAPLVSIIMPSFNAERYVAESIRSVLGQTFTDWELVVVDDGSVDRTAEVVCKLAAEDPRIRYVWRENGGQAAARNTGIRYLPSPVVAFIDADDLWLPEKLARQLSVMEETAADVVYCDGYVFYDDSTPERADFFAVVPGRTDGATMFPLLFAYNRIATLSVVARRDALERVGFFDEDRRLQNCEDYDLWLRLARAGSTFYGMTDKLIRYRRHSASSTHSESKLLGPMIDVMKKHSEDVDHRTSQQRIRGLYRELIATLLAEDDLVGARERMREFASWDKGGLVTIFQRILLQLSPRNFDNISRECLYRTEWHVGNLINKLRSQ
ncbi:MAG TPA: glycosyltransferase [Pyrinomonadaceae bacterium]|jgi:glycosyltransferase involved in cell wall biosynthesis